MNSEICLTCLGKPSQIYTLDDIILENLQIRDLIHQTIPLLLEKQEFSLPDIICEKCKEELVISFNFQKKCLDSIQNLRRKWAENSLNNETINDDTTEYYSYNDNSIGFSPEEDLIKLNAMSVDPLITNNDKNTLLEQIGEKNLNRKSKKSLKDKEDCNNKRIITLPKETPSQIVEEPSTVSNQCKICSRNFKQPQGLASHMSKTHLKKYLYQCKKCSKGFDDEEPFIKHCNLHLGIKPFSCSDCEKSFETTSQLKKHKLSHSRELSYSCELCDKKFYRIDVFKLHKRRHDDQKSFQCLKCDKTFERFSDHIKHLEKHKKENALTTHQQIENIHEQLFRCDQCDEQFNCIENLNLHKKKHTIKMPYQNVSTNEMPEDFILTQVKSENMDDDETSLEDKKDFNSKQKEEEIGSNNKDPEINPMAQTASAQCDICKQIFKNSQGLAIHKSSTHLKNYLYQCDQCDRGFSVEEFYIKHRNHHLGIKTFKCNQCDKVFETNSILNQHLISHSESTPHLCTTCGKAFRRIDSLRQHIKRHGEERPFKCSVCSKGFKCLSDKLNHMLTHSKKRYECQICGTCLASSDSLAQHKMIHTGEKPKKCKHCDKSFISLSNLKCHERIHTGEKPYKCQYCWKSFSQSNDRKKHTKRMHKSELEDTNSEKVASLEDK